MSKGDPVVVVFFGEHPVHGVLAEVDKTKAVIAFGQGAWAVTAPCEWIRQTEAELIVDLG